MSEFSRETLLNIIETDHVQCGEASALARMALAAMDSSESVELPLDYLQGHKDGLEWAARLAEANHPETGDWLYDDPIELAKAIRKGPDMPPAQPVADSYPVIVVGDDGGDALSYRRLIQSFEPGTKLYRHAQPEPVVSAELLHTAASAIEDLLTTKDRTGACVWFDLPFRLRSAANAHSAPDGYVMVPKEPTDEMIAAAMNCEDVLFNSDDSFCVQFVNIYEAMLATAPQSPGSEPATIPGKWIPVSERMPEAEGHYLVWANASRIDGYCDHLAIATYQGGEWSNEFNWLVNHWMPLPAAPQEEK